MSDPGIDRIFGAMDDAELKAWQALAGYKFWMFGYHAGRWVNYNHLLGSPRANPFAAAVRLAHTKLAPDSPEQETGVPA